MRKIISLFQRDYDGNRLVLNEVVPGAEWVIAGEGVATRKWDGTCCLVRDGKLYKRYEVKAGNCRAPVGFEPAGEVDSITGKTQGWVPVGEGPEDKWHREAFEFGYGVTGRKELRFEAHPIEDGTWELIGPKIQGNPEDSNEHLLVKHGACPMPDCPRDFNGIREYLATHDIEGIVWHHPDGRMVKIKGKDFGLKRKKE